MVMIGAYLGGPGTTIPAGYGELDLFWTTNDGQNQQVTFNIVGPQTTSVQSDANGQASLLLPAGSYTVTPVYTGEYLNIGAKIVTVLSKERSTLIWVATPIPKQTVQFISSATIASATYEIAKDGSVEEVGSGWTTSVPVSLTPGDYTLEVTAYGDSQSMEFTVVEGVNIIDASGMFCKITASCNTTLFSLKYNSNTIKSGSFTSVTFDVVRTSSSRTVLGVLPTTPSYEGLNTNKIYTTSMSSRNVTPSGATASVSLTCKRTGRVVVLTRDGTLTVPNAIYKLLVMGGGGGGGGTESTASNPVSGNHNAGGGGGGGYAVLEDVVLNGSYNVVIGAGGAGATNANDYSEGESGEASSFGDYSANGGRGGTYRGDGGNGGSGGGGGVKSTGTVNGGAGVTFGGGGASGRVGNGGSGGTYGGAGGGKGKAGSAGISETVFNKYISATGGAAGNTNMAYMAGGGGGGGYSAKGGAGGASSLSNAYKEYGSGGGGGGGIAGGTGGAGGAVSSTSSDNPGNGGRGYGAGGGGWSNGAWGRGGGGGGGGYGSTAIAGDGTNEVGGDGAQGCVVIQWIGDA